MNASRVLRGAAVTVVLAVPTMAVEETWDGRPMIDAPGHTWLVPAAIVVLAFAAGGAVGAGRRTAWAAALGGVAVGLIGDATLVAADIVGRVTYYGKDLSWPVARLWLLGGAVALVASVAGARLGESRRAGWWRGRGV